MRHAELLHNLLDSIEVADDHIRNQLGEILFYSLLWEEGIASIINLRYPKFIDSVHGTLA